MPRPINTFSTAEHTVVAPVKIFSQINIDIDVTKNEQTIAAIPSSTSAKLKKIKHANGREAEATRYFMKFKNVELGKLDGTGFEIHLISGSISADLNINSPSFVGTISLFNHTHKTMGNHHHAVNDQVFEITSSARLLQFFENITIVIKPFSLYDGRREQTITEPLKISGIEFYSQG